MNMKIPLFIILFTLIFVSSTSVFADGVPVWVKNNAGWWADDTISETEFLNAIEYLINLGIIQISETTENDTKTENVPKWVKNNAGWWADDTISETEFLNAIEFLVKNGIISIVQPCKFESDIDQYSHLNEESIKFLCDDTFDLRFIDKKTISRDWYQPEVINSQGFRGAQEVSLEKAPNTYRIIMIGGSTTFGDTTYEDETYPAYLQKKFQSANLDFEIEIINSGSSGWWSKPETNLIKEKLIDFNPDMFIVYDGWNDVRQQNGEPQSSTFLPNPEAGPIQWKDRWIESCQLTEKYNIKTVVALQPILGTGERLMTNEEKSFFDTHYKWIETDLIQYKKFGEQLEEIENFCDKTIDLRNIFDGVDEPIFADLGHTDSIGNKIIANHIFHSILPIVLGNDELATKILEHDYSNKQQKKLSIPPDLDFRGKNLIGDDFSGRQDLSDSIFWLSELQDVDFSNANLENADFRFAKMLDVDFSGANLKNAKFPRSFVYSSNFSNTDLTGSYLAAGNFLECNFSHAILDNINPMGTKFEYVKFDNALLSNTLFQRSSISVVDFTNTTFNNVVFNSSDLYGINFIGMDFSEISFELDNACAACDFRTSNLADHLPYGMDLTMKIFFKYDEKFYYPASTISGLDLSNTNLSKIVYSHLTSVSDVLNDKSERIKFRPGQAVDASHANLSYGDLSNKILTLAVFTGADMSYTDLSNSDLSYADLRNVTLTGANLANAKLDFADLDDATLDCINHPVCVG